MLEAMVRDMQSDRDWIERAVAQDVLTEAIQRSQGGLSTADQRAMDHPYAKRHGSPRAPMDEINEQTGLFKSSWRVSRGTDGALMVENTDPKAHFLEDGTWKMFGRPLEELHEFAVLAAERRLTERLG